MYETMTKTCKLPHKSWMEKEWGINPLIEKFNREVIIPEGAYQEYNPSKKPDEGYVIVYHLVDWDNVEATKERGMGIGRSSSPDDRWHKVRKGYAGYAFATFEEADAQNYHEKAVLPFEVDPDEIYVANQQLSDNIIYNSNQFTGQLNERGKRQLNEWKKLLRHPTKKDFV